MVAAKGFVVCSRINYRGEASAVRAALFASKPFSPIGGHKEVEDLLARLSRLPGRLRGIGPDAERLAIGGLELRRHIDRLHHLQPIADSRLRSAAPAAPNSGYRLMDNRINTSFNTATNSVPRGRKHRACGWKVSYPFFFMAEPPFIRPTLLSLGRISKGDFNVPISAAGEANVPRRFGTLWVCPGGSWSIPDQHHVLTRPSFVRIWLEANVDVARPLRARRRPQRIAPE